MGGEYGEGIVIKNMTRLNDPDENFQFYVKNVGEAFKEKKAIGGWGMKMLDHKHEKSVEQELTESVVTTARVRKLILKMVDEQELPINWKELDQRTIMRKNVETSDRKHTRRFVSYCSVFRQIICVRPCTMRLWHFIVYRRIDW